MLATDLLTMYREERAAFVNGLFPSFAEWKRQENITDAGREDQKEWYDVYQEEKAEVAGSFKSFAEWKAAYDKQWMEDHTGSSFLTLETAIEITDAEVSFI